MSNRKLQNPTMSTLTLLDLLKRRKTTLKSWMKETGYGTHRAVVEYCHSLGVISPSEEEFNRLNLDHVTDQANGIVVVEVKEQRSRVHTVDPPCDPSPEDKESKVRKKKKIVGQHEGTLLMETQCPMDVGLEQLVATSDEDVSVD